MRTCVCATLVAVFAFAIAYGDDPISRESDLEARVKALEAAVGQLKNERSAIKEARVTDQSVAAQLNGRWRYESATESEESTLYDDTKIELVIDGVNWTTLLNGQPDPAGHQIVKYDFSQTPVSCTRRSPRWAPHSIAMGILKIDGDQLIYTTPPLERPAPEMLGEDSGLPNDKHGHPRKPSTFDPKRTGNTKYVLKRVARSTKLPANKNMLRRGGPAGF